MVAVEDSIRVEEVEEHSTWEEVEDTSWRAREEASYTAVAESTWAESCCRQVDHNTSNNLLFSKSTSLSFLGFISQLRITLVYFLPFSVIIFI